MDYIRSIARLTDLEETFSGAIPDIKVMLFRNLIDQCCLGDPTGEYQSLAHLFTTFYGADLPPVYIETLREAMDVLPELQFSPFFDLVLEIFGLTSQLESYVKAFDNAMDSDLASPVAKHVTRQRRGREKKDLSVSVRLQCHH